MEMDTQKLQRFIDAVNSEIDDKITELLNEAEEEKKAILDGAQKESEQAAERRLEENKKKCSTMFVRDISKAEMDMKKQVLTHRDELTLKLFNDVKNKLISYKSDQKYVDYLIKTIIKLNLTGEAIINLSPDDLKYCDILKKALKSDKISFAADEHIKIGGLSVYNKENGTITDKTFDLAVEEQKQLFANRNALAE